LGQIWSGRSDSNRRL